jgi:lipopolysaccharide transport protein LptA
MVDLFPDFQLHRKAIALLAAMGLFAAASAAEAPQADIDVEGSNPRVNLNVGTLLMNDVTVRQGPGTLIRAKSTSARGLAEGYDNSQWEFKDDVHIEFDGAILDANSAVVQFAENRVRSIVVTGAPAHFSHQLEKSTQRNQGRAGTIEYDARTGQVRFAGGTWYSDGRNEVTTASLVYNVKDGSFFNEGDSADSGRVRLTIRPGKRVPPPRTPDRASAP